MTKLERSPCTKFSKWMLSMPNAQLSALTKMMQSLDVQSQVMAQFRQIMCCELSGDAHALDHCPSHPDSLNYNGNFYQKQNNPFFNAYNSSWRNLQGQCLKHHLYTTPMHRTVYNNLLSKNYQQKKCSCSSYTVNNNICKPNSSSCKLNDRSCKVNKHFRGISKIKLGAPLGKLPSDTQVLWQEDAKECKVVQQ